MNSLPPSHLFAFLEGLDRDLREVLLEKLRVLWTHSSTALEGNTLTEGETYGVLKFGLTVGGKSLQDHNEVIGHARAIDLIYEWCRGDRSLDQQGLFDLHKAVQKELVIDYLVPIGKWKVEANSTLVRLGDKTQINDTYASPQDVSTLMSQWFEFFEKACREESESPAITYAKIHASFARIHPFADGNGRLARLVSNVPLLRRGLPPLLIPLRERSRYISLLAAWQLTLGKPKAGHPLIVENEAFGKFLHYIEECVSESQALVEEVKEMQKKRLES